MTVISPPLVAWMKDHARTVTNPSFGEATVGVAAVGTLPLGFQVKLLGER